MKDFLESVLREVGDCDGRYYKKPTKSITHKYSELAAILLRFKNAGDPSYPNQYIGFCYTDEEIQKYANLEELEQEALVDRFDLKMLGRDFTELRTKQTEQFNTMGFTKRPKSIRSNILILTIYLRLKSGNQQQKQQ